MNFVMDLSVKEFLELHARSRMVDDIESVVDKILIEANKLAGEQFRWIRRLQPFQVVSLGHL